MTKYIFIFVSLFCFLSSFYNIDLQPTNPSFYLEEFEPLDYRYALEDSILHMYKAKIDSDRRLEQRAKDMSRTLFHKMEDNQKEEKKKLLKILDKKGYSLLKEKKSNIYVITSKLDILAGDKVTEILYDISKNNKEIEQNMNLKKLKKILKKL